MSPKTKTAPGKKLSRAAAKLRLLKRLHCTLKFEKLAWQGGATLVAGVDEVGRGPLFGPGVPSAAISAEVERQLVVKEGDPVFPVYGLPSNKGYSTPRHKAALRDHGPSPLHRLSFAPVWISPVPQEVLEFMLDDEELPASEVVE